VWPCVAQRVFILENVVLDIVSILLEAVAGLIGGVLLLRFWMQAIRVRPPGNLAQFIYELTDWLVKPLRRIVPGFGGYDWASLIGVLLILGILASFSAWLTNSFVWSVILKIALIDLLRWIYYGLIGIMLLGAVFSWVNPHAPMAPFVQALSDPLLRPLRRIIPLIGNVDLSPMIAMIVLYILWIKLTQLIIILPL
jgi:YggT family protein